MLKTGNYYYYSANDRTDFSFLEGVHKADICVVGGGFTGLGTALELSKKGYRVILLEAGRIGDGASGASGGQITSGFSPGMMAVEQLAGRDDAAKLWELSERSKQILKDRIHDYKMSCDLEEGEIYAAPKASHYDWLRQEKEHCENRYGFKSYELLNKEGLTGYFKTDRYVGGLLDKEGGHIHPLNYCLGLVSAFKDVGGQIYEYSRAQRFDETGSGITVYTDQGQVSAQALVLAGNAYLNNIAPPLLKRMMPVTSSILATVPLPETVAQQLFPKNACVCDTNFDLDYFKMSSDHRLVYGGQDVSVFGLAKPWERIRRNMLKTFPTLKDVNIDFFWRGKIAFTRTLLPDVGQLSKNVFYAHGYSGQGVTISAGVSELLAKAVAGQLEALDVFSNLPKKPVPSSRLLQAPAIYLASMWYRIRDALD